MEISLARSLDELDSLFAFTRQFAEKHGLDNDTEHPLNIALEEIFTNSVKYTEDTGVNITISLNIIENVIVASILDPGKRFDPTSLPKVDTDLPLEKRKVGGLGIHLTRAMMDGIDYFYKNGINHIIIKKNMESHNV
jgi:anti-sigma regulatory factor (Ser/Thr protein kinase)